MIKWFEKYSAVSWVIVVLICITIFYVSSLTFEQIPRAFRINYKTIIYHFGVFSALALFFNISLIKGKNISLIIPGIIGSGSYALYDEIHQLFVQGRACTFFDLMIDTSGILVASVFYLVYLSFRKA